MRLRSLLGSLRPHLQTLVELGIFAVADEVLPSLLGYHLHLGHLLPLLVLPLIGGRALSRGWLRPGWGHTLGGLVGMGVSMRLLASLAGQEWVWVPQAGAWLAGLAAVLLALAQVRRLPPGWRGLALVVPTAVWMGPHLVLAGLMEDLDHVVPEDAFSLSEAQQEAMGRYWEAAREADADGRFALVAAHAVDETTEILMEEERVRALAREQRFAEALALLDTLAARGPRWGRSERGLLRSLLLEELGDTDAALAEALRATRFEGADTHRGLMDADNTRNLAWRSVATLAEAQGQRWLAFEAMGRWHPHSWCGNAAMEMLREREEEGFRLFWSALLHEGPPPRELLRGGP